VGVAELLILLAILLLVFGAKRLPQLGRSLGKGIRDFREGISGHDDEDIELQAHRNEAEGENPSPSEAEAALGGVESRAEGEGNARTGQKL
jgi:sec-independent protein translocase protein TatA